MTRHELRVAKIVETLRKQPMKTFGPNNEWPSVELPRIGKMCVHRVSQEFAKEMGACEVWVRLGSSRHEYTKEFRGSAETVAKELCKLLKAPSKVVAEAAETIMGMSFNGLKAPEVAAVKGLDEEITYKAFDLLEERGLVSQEISGYSRV